jgi:hypothetical protein
MAEVPLRTAHRILEIDPPSEDYVQDGWHCHYHGWLCHNPLDCDLSPRWILTDEAYRRIMREKRDTDS